jgi:streptogramin lyase
MNTSSWIRFRLVGVLSVAPLILASSALAADHLSGRVLGAGGPIANSTVTLWEAGSNEPKKLAEAKTNDQGQFEIRSTAARGADSFLYLVATGGVPKAQKSSADNPAIVLLTVLGNKPPDKVVINEFTTIASVWTNAQFLDGPKLQGNVLGLRIAAGNVPNFVDLQTGGWGGAIQDPLNGGQTPTMANFATLADVLAGCVTLIRSDACSSLFYAATSPRGEYPKDTLAAAENIARYPWYQPERLLGLLNYLYRAPQDHNLRLVPFMPYLNFTPSAWVLPLKFDGGGLRAGGKGMFDSEGNFWVADNFTVGWQGQDSLWEGHASKFAPNGKPLSPITTGFTGGGMEGGTFGLAVDAKDNAWFSNYGTKSIAVFDKNGKPLSPPEGITFNGRLGLMQGIIATPGGDVWALGISKSQLVYFPKGDINQGRIVCEGENAEPCKSFKAPFHLGIDQQDRIWVANSAIDHITRFPIADPSKTENFKTGGFNASGLAIDSQGNVWLTNRFGSGLLGMAHLVDMGVRFKLYGVTKASDYLTKVMSEQKGGKEGGSVVLLKPDGSQFPGSPFTGSSLPGPWAVAVDGNDNVWVSNFAGASGQIAHLCGVRTENCPPGMKTGDPISPPLGYVGGGLQMEVDVDVDPAGNVWVTNNWQDIDSCVGIPIEGLSTRCAGQGVVVFYGMAKPVHVPLIGPAHQP